MASVETKAKRRKGDDKEETKAAIISHLNGLTTNATAAMGRLDTNIPQQPLLKIEGYGTVGIPVNQLVANEISQYMEQAPYGMGEETIVDKNVRDTLQVGTDKFQITNKKFSQAILTDVIPSVKQELGLKDIEVWAEPYKLLLYKPGGHFKPHRDTEKAAGMFGTLIVQLPSEFTGGDLVVRHAGKEVVVKMSQEGSSSYCVIAAHYSDCEHEITTVETGYRLALVYSLCWRGTGQSPSAEMMVDKAISLQSLLVRYTKMNKTSSSRLCWGLEHFYSDNSLMKGGTGALKGKDRNVVETILSTNQMLEKEDQFEVFLVKASQVRHEYGECSNDRGYCRGWGRDSDDCFEYADCDEIDVELTNFVALTGGVFDMKDDTFNPEEEVLNFEDEDEFWGEGKGECSGPSGNEGATRDMWYHKVVLVMWRKADGLLIKCQVSLIAGLQHIINTCQQGDMIGAKLEVEQVLDFNKSMGDSFERDSDERKILETAYDLALLIDDENIGKKIMEKFPRTEIEFSESVMTKLQSLITKYTWPFLQTTILKMVNKADTISQIGRFAKLFSGLDNPEVFLCEKVLVKLTALKPPAMNYYNKPSSTQLIPVLDLILKFPTGVTMLGKQLASLPCLSTLDMCANVSEYLATILTTNQCVLPVLTALEESFLGQAEKQTKLSQHSAAVTKMTNIMIKLDRETSLQSITRLVLAQPDHQAMLSDILKTVSADTVHIKPPTLLTLVRARVAHLQSLVSRGPPQFSWRQTSAVVPGHPTVEQFFKGNQQQFTYREFTGIGHARNWSSKHSRDKGTCASFSPGGTGAKSYVMISKSKEGFAKSELEPYKLKLKEHKRLKACLPTSTVPGVGQTSTAITSEKTIDLTDD